MRSTVTMAVFSGCLSTLLVAAMVVAEDKPAAGWRNLPLIKDGKVDESWVHTGWGSFSVDNGALRTDCDERGLGLLVYRKEQFGNCQIRVVYKSKDPKSNAGVYVRIDAGILDRIKDQTFPVKRDKDGKLSAEMLEKLMEAGEKEQGPWYAVHHGYEVQICDSADEAHRTGAIYSLNKAAALEPSNDWRTMIITLKGSRVEVEIDGKQVSSFDSDAPARDRTKWHEPKREPKRPQTGYLGLQNHDPGDVVHFKEVSVRPLVVAK